MKYLLLVTATVTLIVLFVVCETRKLDQPDGSLENEWQKFKTVYNKQFKQNGNEEEANRRLIFQNNLDYIKDHNQKADMGRFSYRLEINQFGDLTTEEMKSYLTTLKVGVKNEQDEEVDESDDSEDEEVDEFEDLEDEDYHLPDTLDWRNRGAVTAVKNQGLCKSSWAFAFTGVLEAQFFRRTRNLTSFSEQQLIDCSKYQLNHGCYGGNIENALSYAYVYGMQDNFSYPYLGHQDVCHFDKQKVVIRPLRHESLNTGNETHLQFAVASYGPVTAHVKTCAQPFLFYKSGIYDQPNCHSDTANHYLLVVGYDEGYWLLKNCFGTNWGENGYIRMVRDKDNQSGIASDVAMVEI